MRLHEARGPRSFDIHEHIIVARSHLLYYNLGYHHFQKAYDALSVQQRNNFAKEMRRSAKHLPTRTILSSFEPEKMGETKLSISDYAVLITVSPKFLQYLVHTKTTSPHAVAALGALQALRQFAAVRFYRPKISIYGESAMRELPTVADLQRLSEGLMIQLRLLLPFFFLVGATICSSRIGAALSYSASSAAWVYNMQAHIREAPRTSQARSGTEQQQKLC